jgi:hypothetical protein
VALEATRVALREDVRSPRAGRLLLTDARRPARTRADGALVPLAEQDRGQWDAGAIAEGVDLLTATLAVAPIGPYQLQAAIAAVHDEAARPENTDWPQILALYGLLDTLMPGPMVTLNRIVASPWSTARRLVSASSPRWRRIRRWPGTTASTPCARTCWTPPATTKAPASSTSGPRALLSASPSSATSNLAPPSSRAGESHVQDLEPHIRARKSLFGDAVSTFSLEVV